MFEYYIDIMKYGKNEPTETKGPFNERKANKIDDGININLNHEEYYTVIRSEET